MGKWRALLLTLATLGSGAAAVHAQQAPSKVFYARIRHFRIPIDIAPQDIPKLKQLQLFVSNDQGRSWQPSAIAPPNQEYFHFICDRDGFYWFSIQTLDKEGKLYPASMANAYPSLKVVVDTLPPSVQLRPLPVRNGQIGVEWSIQEEHLDTADPQALRLEYRAVGGMRWIPLTIDPRATQHYWNPETNAELEVRLQVVDQAKNSGEATTRISASHEYDGTPNYPSNTQNQNPPSNDRLPSGYDANAPNRRLVRSRRISLNYQLEDVGPSGVSTIELWYTQDGRSWNRFPLAKPAEGAKPANPLVFEVNGEGVYGFTLIAKSGVGLGVQPPQIGDRPQIWVEVDETNPKVTLQSVTVGRGVDKGKVMIRWSATDKNLDNDSIKISYAESATGPWTPIMQQIRNSGHFVWDISRQQMPYQFWVRVEATDQAGNVGHDTTREVVRVDLSMPKVNILDVGPAGGN